MAQFISIDVGEMAPSCKQTHWVRCSAGKGTEFGDWSPRAGDDDAFAASYAVDDFASVVS